MTFEGWSDGHPGASRVEAWDAGRAALREEITAELERRAAEYRKTQQGSARSSLYFAAACARAGLVAVLEISDWLGRPR